MAGCSVWKVIHSKNLLRSGTLVGSFKMDVGTVYSQPGEWLRGWVGIGAHGSRSTGHACSP